MSAAENSDPDVASATLRGAQLEREATGSIRHEAKGAQRRRQALVLAIAEVIWTRDSSGGVLEEPPRWMARTEQPVAEDAP